MRQRRFLADGSSTFSGGRGDDLKDWLSLLMPLFMLPAGMAGAWLIWQVFTTPFPSAPAPSSPLPTSSSSDSFATLPEATFPPEILVAANALATSLAPTPALTPSPTSVLPPAAVAMVCGPGLETGSICTMPTTSPPSPTPLPICPTTPGSECEWRGSTSSGTPLATHGGERN